MVSSCSAPAAAGSSEGEAGLLCSARAVVSLKTQHQEQLKPDLEDKQWGLSVGRSPCFESESPQRVFGKFLPAQKGSFGGFCPSLGCAPWFEGEWISDTWAKRSSKRWSLSKKERKIRKWVTLKDSPKGSKFPFLLRGMKGCCSYMTTIAFLTLPISIIAAKFSQDSMFTLKKSIFPFY